MHPEDVKLDFGGLHTADRKQKELFLQWLAERWKPALKLRVDMVRKSVNLAAKSLQCLGRKHGGLFFLYIMQGIWQPFLTFKSLTDVFEMSFNLTLMSKFAFTYCKYFYM